MNNWISALAELQNQGEPCVLVTIIEERGSTPRNAGSKMVVSGERIFDTIGGGHLEYKAMQIARQMLATGSHDTRLERFNLGASLGQCCGRKRSVVRTHGSAPGTYRGVRRRP